MINVVIFFSLVFLPNILLAITTSINLMKKNSWKIFLNQISFILLPTFTFFTFQRLRLNYCCCSSQTDDRVRFSPIMTQVNIIIAVAGYLGWILWINETYHPQENLWLSLYTTIPLLLAGILLTEIYIYFDKFCCSIPEEEIHVYDPDKPEDSFLLKAGIVEEIDNEDVEPSVSNNLTMMG